MRMWGIPPERLCRQHLLGEHVEMHAFVGLIRRGSSLEGYTSSGLVDVRLIRERHELLVDEMLSRRYHHRSPLPDFDLAAYLEHPGYVDVDANLEELERRCPRCAARFPLNSRDWFDDESLTDAERNEGGDL